MRLKCLLLLLVLAPVAGCTSCESQSCWSSVCWPNCYVACIDDAKTEVRAKILADDALRRNGCYDAPCHYKLGFCQAYVDVAEGSDGLIPATPPQRYWGLMFRNEPGHERANQWFAGYSDGVDSAISEGLSNFNWVPLSTPSGGAGVVEPGVVPGY